MSFRKNNRVRVRPTAVRRAASAVVIEAVEQRTMMSATAATAAVLSPDAIYVRPALTAAATSTTSTPVDGALTPAETQLAYGFSTATFSSGTVAANGAGQTIAIVDAYNDPNIAADLKVFDAEYGLAAPASLKVVNQTGGTTLPANNAGWAGEIALDVEWAHAIAPGANILLVETSSDDTNDLLAGVNYARDASGVSVVSMSWGGSEFESYTGGESTSQTAYDSDFTTPSGHQGVTFVSAAGDSGEQDGVQWPASSPNVLSVGGTTLYTNADGSYQTEAGWAGTSSGYSTVEAEPAYQDVTVNTTGMRSVADVSYDADPDTGFSVYDSVPDTDDGTTYVGWQEVGGTSAGAPQWSALIADADQGRKIAGLSTLDGATQTLPDLYDLYSAYGTAGYTDYTNYFNDVTSGGSGSTGGFGHGGGRHGHSGYSAAAGYDVVTGLGTPKAAALIDDLATSAAVTAPAGTGATPTPTATGGSTPATATTSPVTISLLTTPLASVITGSAGVIKVELTNSSSTTFSGPVQVGLFTSTDGTTATEASLTSVTLKAVKLRAGASRVVTIKYDNPTTAGSYYLLAAADATATDTQDTTVVTTSAITVSAPTVDLSVAFAGSTAVTVTPGKKGKAVVTLANLGNVTATGPVTLTLAAVASDGSVAQVYVVTRKVKLAAGKAMNLTLPFTAPADVDAGTYTLQVTITPATTVADTNASNNTATTATV